MADTGIERIRMPDVGTFYNDYIRTRTPVIVTDLFSNDDLAGITSQAAARKAFGGAKLSVRKEYLAAMADGSRDDRLMTLNEYLDLAEQCPGTTLMCTEYEVPAPVMCRFKLPAVCTRGNGCDADEIMRLPRRYGDYDILPNFFVANRGNKAHVHYDGDQRHVLLYQVFGRKQVMLFPPQVGAVLNVLDCPIPYAGVSFEHMTDDQKCDFALANGGSCDTLQPGEAIFMPMLFWHYLEYTDTAMSINVRFGRNRYGRFLCVDNFHRDYYIQNVASRFVDERETAMKYQKEIDRVVAAFSQPSVQTTKIVEMRRLFKELFALMCPGATDYCPPAREASELDKIIKDSAPTLRYASREMIVRSRPTGTISATQRHHISEGAQRCGYSPAILGRVLMNRVGKTDVDRLTQAEAAQFIAYMKSPGASSN